MVFYFEIGAVNSLKVLNIQTLVNQYVRVILCPKSHHPGTKWKGNFLLYNVHNCLIFAVVYFDTFLPWP